MEQLRAVLRQVDDDYLTGLSNKGIVKRAYKDLAEESPGMEWQEETAQVTLKSETCLIKNPLGESTCSCPSSGICRHVVTAILWLKKEMEQDGEEEVQVLTEVSSDEGAAIQEELMSVPLERLKRACGSRRYQWFLTHMKSGELPDIAETSIVTVTIPWENATVRLLSPLEYSTCTCHSKELCGHKAQALLIYQFKHGIISLKDLEQLDMPEHSMDLELAKEAAGKIQEHILSQFEIGLSRQSLEVEESLERLAIICHRAGLANFERRLREAASDYQQYFERSASFRSQELLKKLLALYELAGQVLTVQTQAELSSLAGSFRSDFEPVGRLHLIGMGARSFQSKTGYEGEIYYFLETKQKKWFTWTDLRPTFYEGMRKRPSASADISAAPWGLNCNREQMTELEFELKNAKAAFGGRLSASQETKGEPLGPRNLDLPEIQEMIYEDYGQLLDDYFGLHQHQDAYVNSGISDDGKRREKLALIQVCDWEEPSFDFVSQRFSWGLHDSKKNTIFISLRYTKSDKLIITMLERLKQRLKRQEEKKLLFLGTVYLDGGRLCLYPIEFFRKEKEQTDSSPQDSNITEDILPDSVFNVMAQYQEEAIRTLSDLLISGLSSVQEDTVSALSLLSEDGKRMGILLAGEEFSHIRDMLVSRRHQMDFRREPVIEAMGRLCRYLIACEQKLWFDHAKSNIRKKINV